MWLWARYGRFLDMWSIKSTYISFPLLRDCFFLFSVWKPATKPVFPVIHNYGLILYQSEACPHTYICRKSLHCLNFHMICQNFDICNEMFLFTLQYQKQFKLWELNYFISALPRCTCLNYLKLQHEHQHAASFCKAPPSSPFHSWNPLEHNSKSGLHN